MVWTDSSPSKTGGEFFVMVGDQRKIVFLDKIPYLFNGHTIRTGDTVFHTIKCVENKCKLCSISPARQYAYATVYDITISGLSFKKLYFIRNYTLEQLKAVCRDAAKNKKLDVNDISYQSFIVMRITKREPSSGGVITHIGKYTGEFSDTKLFDYESICSKTDAEIDNVLMKYKEYRMKVNG